MKIVRESNVVCRPHARSTCYRPRIDSSADPATPYGSCRRAPSRTRAEQVATFVALLALALVVTAASADENSVLAEVQTLTKRLESQCKPIVTALREAKRVGSYSFRPNLAKDDGCIEAPADFTVESLKSAISAVLTLASAAGAPLLDAASRQILKEASDAVVAVGSTACFSPVSEAKKRYDIMLEDALAAVREIEKLRDQLRAEWSSVEATLKALRDLPKGSNEFEVRRLATTNRVTPLYAYCKANLIDP